MRIGIDLGGTNIRVASFDKGKTVKKLQQPCKNNQPANVIIDQLKSMIHDLIVPETTNIGIGVPSVVDAEKGIVYGAMNIPSWKEVHLKEIIEKEFNIPVRINNDCNCFTLGEHTFGNGHKYKNMVGITLGTGLGAGVIINNELYNGSNTGAGEICSIPYLEHNYEYYCSSHFFVCEFNTTGHDAYQKAEIGDEVALERWKKMGHHIGNMIKLVLFVYDPQCIALGGSISNAYRFFESSMNETIRTFPYKETIRKLRIYKSTTENIALLGASML